MTMSTSTRTVIDAQGLILGRMASTVAKRLLEGELIEVVNAEAAVVSGKRSVVLQRWLTFLNRGGARRGPIHQRKPSLIIRRTIRGMLPYRSAHGREAFKRLRVYIGVPEELAKVERETIPQASVERLSGRYVTVGEVAERIGWKK